MKINKFVDKYLILGVSICFFTLTAKNGYLPNAINGVEITPQSLSQLAPRVPERLRADLHRWFSDQETVALLNRLTDLQDSAAWALKKTENDLLLAEAGYENLSSNGYSARIPNLDYLFKIAGQKDRVISMLATKGIVLSPRQQSDTILAGYVAQYLSETLPTYQTASRMAYYLLLEQRARKKGYKHVHFPKSYLIRLPNKPIGVEDSNVMLVQQVVPNSEMLVHNPERATHFTKGVLKELVDAVISAGLWNVQRNILVSTSGSVYVVCNVDLVGLSQQKNSSAKDFFHKSKERFDENVYIGLKGLLDLFKENPEKVAYIKKRIKKDKRLKDSCYSNSLKELIK